jgi:hypothetical protein
MSASEYLVIMGLGQSTGLIWWHIQAPRIILGAAKDQHNDLSTCLSLFSAYQL